MWLFGKFGKEPLASMRELLMLVGAVVHESVLANEAAAAAAAASAGALEPLLVCGSAVAERWRSPHVMVVSADWVFRCIAQGCILMVPR